MNIFKRRCLRNVVSAGCHINDVMNSETVQTVSVFVSAGCHINDVMNLRGYGHFLSAVSAGCHINDVMNKTETHRH